jgi:hypothetical protein
MIFSTCARYSSTGSQLDSDHSNDKCLNHVYIIRSILTFVNVYSEYPSKFVVYMYIDYSVYIHEINVCAESRLAVYINLSSGAYSGHSALDRCCQNCAL